MIRKILYQIKSRFI